MDLKRLRRTEEDGAGRKRGQERSEGDRRGQKGTGEVRRGQEQKGTRLGRTGNEVDKQGYVERKAVQRSLSLVSRSHRTKQAAVL